MKHYDVYEESNERFEKIGEQPKRKKDEKKKDQYLRFQKKTKRYC
jgi:hypothetical protein